MTIVAAVKSRDALVLGTDSMTQVIGVAADGRTPTWLKSYSNATKLFRLGSYDIAAATWGSGNIGNRSIGSLVLDYVDSLDSAPRTIGEATNGLATSAGMVYDAAFGSLPIEQQPTLGFLVGGYSAGQPLPELWEIRLPQLQDMPQRTRPLIAAGEFGAVWRGIEGPFTRLYMGFDPRLIDEFVALGIDRALAIQTLSKYPSSVLIDSMPIQDAVDFARHILRTTIGVSTFELGAATCGEPLQLAVILRNQGFQWVEQPRFHV